MSKDNSASRQNGIGFTGMLTLLFVAAKLFGFIAWSWWWVFSPILIVVGLFVAFLFGVFLLASIGAYFGERNRGR